MLKLSHYPQNLTFFLGHELIPTMTEIITHDLNWQVEGVHCRVTFPYQSDRRVLPDYLSFVDHLPLSKDHIQVSFLVLAFTVKSYALVPLQERT